ncbi:MAG: hypothetical protein WAL13_17495 [Trebonia sp.]
MGDATTEAYLSRFSAHDLLRACADQQVSLSSKERSSLESAILTDTQSIRTYFDVWRTSAVSFAFDIDAYEDPIRPSARR